jgi:hypothetical protein
MKEVFAASGTTFAWTSLAALGGPAQPVLRTPEVVLGLGRHVARARQQRLAVLDQAPDVIRVEMGDHDDVDLLGREPGAREEPGQPARVRPASGAIPGIEQDQFRAGVDDHRSEADHHLVRRQEVLRRERLNLGRGHVRAEDRVRSVHLNRAIGNRRDLEVAEVEAVVRGRGRSALGRRRPGQVRP